jgi:hypothetical protein
MKHFSFEEKIFVNQTKQLMTVVAPCREIGKPNWMQEIQDDVIEECSKYGGVVHIRIDQESPEGNIFVKCPSIAVASATVNGLNGRYFSGNLSAVFFNDSSRAFTHLCFDNFRQANPGHFHSARHLQQAVSGLDRRSAGSVGVELSCFPLFLE